MSPPSSPKPSGSSQPAPSASSSTQKRALTDVISETFPAFNHRATVVEPFDNESKRDAEFLEKLNIMLLELMLDFHAWSTARPTHESDRTADELEREINGVMELEKEQGTSLLEKTRQRLNEFVTRIKLALAVLTGLAP